QRQPRRRRIDARRLPDARGVPDPPEAVRRRPDARQLEGLTMVHHLHSGDASLVVDTSRGVPEVVWWGAALDTADEATVAAARPPATAGGLDTIAPLALVAEHGSGFMEHPGILGSRGDGSAWAPRFALVAERAGDDRLEIVCRDDVAALELV